MNSFFDNKSTARVGTAGGVLLAIGITIGAILAHRSEQKITNQVNQIDIGAISEDRLSMNIPDKLVSHSSKPMMKSRKNSFDHLTCLVGLNCSLNNLQPT